MEVFSMKHRLTVAAVTIFLGASAAWAQEPGPRQSNNSPYTDTLYATDQHMGFSIRNTLLRWLGGVDVARERDAKAAEKEGWWGEPAAQVSASQVEAPKTDR
jgi:hypothetical protein